MDGRVRRRRAKRRQTNQNNTRLKPCGLSRFWLATKNTRARKSGKLYRSSLRERRLWRGECNYVPSQRSYSERRCRLKTELRRDTGFGDCGFQSGTECTQSMTRSEFQKSVAAYAKKRSSKIARVTTRMAPSSRRGLQSSIRRRRIRIPGQSLVTSAATEWTVSLAWPLCS